MRCCSSSRTLTSTSAIHTESKVYDIEVIEGRSYAVIGEGTPAYMFLKSMNSRLTMKKLASEPGEEISLTLIEMAKLNTRFKQSDYKRLVDVDLVKHRLSYEWNGERHVHVESYTFTDFGLEIMAAVKEEGDIEIPL